MHLTELLDPKIKHTQGECSPLGSLAIEHGKGGSTKRGEEWVKCAEACTRMRKENMGGEEEWKWGDVRNEK